MPFCIFCGQQNQEQSKFCIRCGKSLNAGTVVQQVPPLPPTLPKPPALVAQPSPAPAPEPDTTAYPAPKGASRNANRGLLVALLIVGILGLSLGAYFIFTGGKKKAGNVNSVPSTAGNGNSPAALKETDSSTINNTIPNVDTPPVLTRPAPTATGKVRDMRTEGDALTEEEMNGVSRTLNGLFDAENQEDIPAVMAYFSFPVGRYYDMRNVSYVRLKERFDAAMVAKLQYHKIYPDYESSVIKKTYNGYQVSIKAVFEYITYKTPDETKTRDVTIVYQLNPQYKITSAYEL